MTTYDKHNEFNTDDEDVLRERIQNGIALLDSVDPTILDNIDRDGLDLGSGCMCILGQTGHILDIQHNIAGNLDFGDFTGGYCAPHHAPDPLDYDIEDEKLSPLFMSLVDAAEHGFFLGGLNMHCSRQDYNRLTTLWVEALEKRDANR